LDFELTVGYPHADVMRLWADILVNRPCLRDSEGRTQSLNYTSAFALKLRKSLNQGSRKVPSKGALARFVVSTWPPFNGRSRLAC